LPYSAYLVITWSYVGQTGGLGAGGFYRELTEAAPDDLRSRGTRGLIEDVPTRSQGRDETSPDDPSKNHLSAGLAAKPASPVFLSCTDLKEKPGPLLRP
jgi:hypothetical protein